MYKQINAMKDIKRAAAVYIFNLRKGLGDHEGLL